MNNTLILAAALSLASAASAQVVAADDFSYIGPLTDNGWAAHSGAGNKVINSDGNVARLEFSGGSGEDVNMPFAPFATTATMYASFTLNVPSGSPVNPDINGSYFAHFKDTGFAFRARTGLLSPVAGGDYALGINADSSSIGAGAVWPSDLAFDTNYTVVISWNAATGESQLWLDPTSMASASISHVGTNTGDVIEQFAWRQSNDHTGFIDVDDLVVGGSFTDVTVPDPANAFVRADSPYGCNGLPLHFTSSTVPADPASPASWATGTTAALTVSNIDPTINIAVLVLGTSNVSFPVLGGLLIPAPDLILVVPGTNGQATATLAVPAGLSGQTFWTQFAAFDSCIPAGELTFTNGQRHLLP